MNKKGETLRPLWTGKLKGKMHNSGITCTELAEYMGVSKQYISYLLSGKRQTKNAAIRLNIAVDQIIESKRGETNAESRTHKTD